MIAKWQMRILQSLLKHADKDANVVPDAAAMDSVGARRLMLMAQMGAVADDDGALAIDEDSLN